MQIVFYLLFSQLIAVYDEQEPHRKSDGTNGNVTDRSSPDLFEAEVAAQLAAFQPIGGEIEVTPSALKLGMYILRGYFSAVFCLFFTNIQYLFLLCFNFMYTVFIGGGGEDTWEGWLGWTLPFTL